MMKVCLEVALKHDIPLKVIVTKNSPLSEYKTFRGYMAGNVEYLATLDKALEKYYFSFFALIGRIFEIQRLR